MKPIGPLMKEHRAIERMIALMEVERRRIEETRKADSLFIYNVFDFFTIYVDRIHHTKEEDIQFKVLDKKDLTPELRRIMEELIDEHEQARDIISALGKSLKDYEVEKQGAEKDIAKNLGAMIELYPMHIEKEDKHFFFPTLEYLSRKEQDKMLQDFREFDTNIIHEKYNKVVDDMKDRLE